MIYGLNFGRAPIPDDVRKLFKKRVRVEGNSHILVGACQYRSELVYMTTVANNGRRKIHAIERGGWFGFYAG